MANAVFNKQDSIVVVLENFYTSATGQQANPSSGKNPRGDVDHLYITSLIDRNGAMRVQYLGYRFDPEEMLRDLRALLRE